MYNFEILAKGGSWTMPQPQTYWKQIKLPPDLLELGWALIKSDSTAPFSLENARLNLTTGGYPDPAEAIERCREMIVEAEERAAIAEGGESSAAPGGDAVVLPVNLLDEGWQIKTHRRQSPERPFEAVNSRHNLKTGGFATIGDAVARAIELETGRQLELERRESGGPEKPAEVLIEIKRIRTDGGTQQRAIFESEVVEEYADAMRAGVVFPAVDLFFDGTDYWLADGYYRVQACEVLNRKEIAAAVRPGSQRDAILFSLGANSTHGQPRTREDKRLAVWTMLEDPEWSIWSDHAIAEKTNVSQPFVSKLRKELEREAQQETAGAAPLPGEETNGHHKTAGAAAGLSAERGPGAVAPAKRRGKDGKLRTARTAAKAPAKKSPAAAAEQLTIPGGATLGQPDTCSECGKEIIEQRLEGGAHKSGYRDSEGRCFDCAAKAKQTAKQAKQSTVGESDHAAHLRKLTGVSIESILKESKIPELCLAFTWAQKKKAVALEIASDLSRVTLAKGPKVFVDSIMLNLSGKARPVLPDAVLLLVQKALTARAARPAAPGKGASSKGATSKRARGKAKSAPKKSAAKLKTKTIAAKLDLRRRAKKRLSAKRKASKR
jgi:hypothetical protein